MKRIDYSLFRATIVALSGIRIGGSDDILQIGGADLTVIKHPATLMPYLPGSSIKGKMRSELEKRGAFNSQPQKGQPCYCGQCGVCYVFGSLGSKSGPTRIIVRDAPLIGEPVIENKSSTAIDRNSGAARSGSLRSEERVAAGAQFALEIGLQIFEGDDAKQLREVVIKGLEYLETSGIGAGVGKGNGRIRLDDKSLRHGEPKPELPWPDSED